MKLSLQKRGMLIYLLAILIISMMDASVKWLSHTYPIGQVVFFRVAFAFLPIGLLFYKNRIPFRTQRPWLHLARGLVGVATIAAFFYSLRYLPLADTTALALTAPLFSIAMGVFILKEKVGWLHWGAGILGFMGVLFVMPPGEQSLQLMALLAVLAAFSFSVASVLTRILGRSDPPLLITFYSHVVMLVVACASLLVEWQTPPVEDLAVFFFIGITGGLGNYLIVVAFKYTPVSTIAPLEYTFIFWAGLFGFLLWADIPTLSAMLGMTLIVGSGLFLSKIKGHPA